MENAIYYTPKALAERWGCHVCIVYDLLRKGKLKGYKLGKDWRISDEARAAFEAAGGAESERKPGRRKTAVLLV